MIIFILIVHFANQITHKDCDEICEYIRAERIKECFLFCHQIKIFYFIQIFLTIFIFPFGISFYLYSLEYNYPFLSIFLFSLIFYLYLRVLIPNFIEFLSDLDEFKSELKKKNALFFLIVLLSLSILVFGKEIGLWLVKTSFNFIFERIESLNFLNFLGIIFIIILFSGLIISTFCYIFLEIQKSAYKTITPIIKKENHVIEKGFSFNFSERLADIFTWKNLKNNQILNYFLFLSLFILFATRFDSIGNIFNIPIFLFLLFLFSGLVLPVYFIQKKILTQINLEKTWEEIIFLSIKTASFVILFGLFSVFLWLIVELLSENRKETMMVIFQYWYKKTFLGWQLNYFIMLSLLSSLFIFLKFLHIQENR